MCIHFVVVNVRIGAFVSKPGVDLWRDMKTQILIRMEVDTDDEGDSTDITPEYCAYLITMLIFTIQLDID